MHGVTSWYVSVLPRLRAHGVDVRCCFLRDPHPVAAQVRDGGVPVEFLAVSKWNPFIVQRVVRFARGMQVDVVHSLGMESALLGRWVARRAGAALLIHSHDMNVPPLWLRVLYRCLRLRGERGLAVSEAVAALMPRAYGMRAGSAGVLHNGVDIGSISQASGAGLPPTVPRDARLLGWVGRLHEVKGPLRMIRAMARLVEYVPDAHLLMIGDGPAMGDCVRLIADLRLDGRVSLLGQRQDVAALLGHLRLLGITSCKEGFSLVAVEAAAAGVPVVGYAVGGLPEVVKDGITGRLVPDADEQALVAAMRELLEDDVLRSRMGKEAQRHAEAFSLERHVQNLVAEYRQLRGVA